MTPKNKTALLIGPQGIGKSLHARALADAMGLAHVADPLESAEAVPDDTLGVTSNPDSRAADHADLVIRVGSEAQILEAISSFRS